MKKEQHDYKMILFFIIFIIGISAISIYFTRIAPNQI